MWTQGGLRGAGAGLALLAGLTLTSCDAFQKGFNDSFNKTTHDSCVTSTTQHGAAPDMAETYCTCFVQQLAPLSMQQKQALKPESPEIAAAAAACNARIQQPMQQPQGPGQQPYSPQPEGPYGPAQQPQGPYAPQQQGPYGPQPQAPQQYYPPQQQQQQQ